MNSSLQGSLAETQAADYLVHKGHKLIARNFRAVGGEIDLVTLEDKTLVFVEVKQRASQAFGGPIAAVNARKQKRIVQAALQFIKMHKKPAYEEIRFDVICILPAEINHIENAFFPPRMTI